MVAWAAPTGPYPAVGMAKATALIHPRPRQSQINKLADRIRVRE